VQKTLDFRTHRFYTGAPAPISTEKTTPFLQNILKCFWGPSHKIVVVLLLAPPRQNFNFVKDFFEKNNKKILDKKILDKKNPPRSAGMFHVEP